MLSNLTRGGLKPAKLKNLSKTPVEELNVMFNPNEYTISKETDWQQNTVSGRDVPRTTFRQGKPRTLSLVLWFDTFAQGTSVTQYTDKLIGMMMIDQNNVSSDTNRSQPPEVEFEWKELAFRAVIKSCQLQFTLFKADGTPVRCKATLSLMEILPEEAQPAQVEGASATSTASAVTQTAGDRPDNLAGANGDSAGMRALMAANNVGDPLNIPAGRVLGG
jgi:hypothetical protein